MKLAKFLHNIYEILPPYVRLNIVLLLYLGASLWEETLVAPPTYGTIKAGQLQNNNNNEEKERDDKIWANNFTKN